MPNYIFLKKIQLYKQNLKTNLQNINLNFSHLNSQTDEKNIITFHTWDTKSSYLIHNDGLTSKINKQKIQTYGIYDV